MSFPLPVCAGVSHVGLVYPMDANDDTLFAFLNFWARLGCTVEIVPSAADIAGPTEWYSSLEKYRQMGFRVVDAPEDENADRAGSCRRLRARRRYGRLYASYSMVPLSIYDFANIVDALPGLHAALEFQPSDLPLLLQHPARERGPTYWGQTRTNISVFLKDPFGLEIECQTTCHPTSD